MNATNDTKESDLAKLSRREREVFNYLVMDLSMRGIGERLFLSPKTIAVHKHNMCAKLGVKSRVGLVLLAKRAGVLKDDVAA